MYGPATQCINETYYQVFQLSAIVPNCCPQHKSSLINFDQWPSAGCFDQPSFRRPLNSSISRPEF